MNRSIRILLPVIPAILFSQCLDLDTLLSQQQEPVVDPCREEIDAPVEGLYTSCLPLLDDKTIDIVTWNLENFPKATSTLSHLQELISTFQPDIIAAQEIESVSSFLQLAESLPGYDAIVGSGFQRLGYLFNTAELTVVDTLELFKSDSYAFPRSPLQATIQHVSGTELILLNVHLKCCDDAHSINRRRTASIKLKNYIDEHLNNEPVVMLGDMNEEITQPEGNDILTIFFEDDENYRFADEALALCSPAVWSYPDWPSHIDHILITNELFDNVSDVRTLTIRRCDPDFKATITDHHPLLVRLRMED